MAAESAQVSGERIGNPLSAAFGNRPTHRVRGSTQHQAEGGTWTGVERHGGVRRDAREQRARAAFTEARLGQGAGGPNRIQSESRKGEGRARKMDGRTEHVVTQARPRFHQRLEQTAPRLSVGAEAGASCFQRAVENQRSAVIEWMRERRLRLDPLETIVRQRVLLKARRRDSQRVYGGADVMLESRQRQLGCARAPADQVIVLMNGHVQTGRRQFNRRRQTVWSRANNGGGCFRGKSQPRIL